MTSICTVMSLYSDSKLSSDASRSFACAQVNPEGKYVVDIDKDVDINKCTPNTRVALRNDSYVLHKILPTKVEIT